MAINFIPTIGQKDGSAVLTDLTKVLRDGSVYPQEADIIIYTGWPQVKDYDGRTHSSDLTAFGTDYGIKLVKISLSSNFSEVRRDAQSILQAAATTDALLSKSLKLKRRRKLIFDVVPIIYAPNLDGGHFKDEEVEFASNEAELIRLLKRTDESLTTEQRDEVQAIIEGAKALGQITEVDDDETLQPIARAYRNLEAIIYNFDASQRSVALTAIKGPQRIRGLAGTGKTVILAMKAALAHIENPNAKILITYYTRSLRDIIERLITRFHRHFAEVDPNWENVHVRHGWGRANVPGVYRDACIRDGIAFKSFGDVKHMRDPFGTVCSELIKNGPPSAYYDVILVDEGQDFPDSFYQMCFFLAKGTRDEKQIIWAYDELQNIFDVKVREPEQLFGKDDDGVPRISLTRSLPLGTDTNDFVLQRAYRNQRDILVLAHSIGFGVYGQPVQMLENAKHWEDVGYDVVSGDFTTGSLNIVERPMVNSPSALATPKDVRLIDIRGATDMSNEVELASREIRQFIEGGIQPHEILVISLDDKSARGYFSALSTSMLEFGVPCNNIINDPYSEPPFRIDGKITLSTVFRAKGNEAAVVIILGADAAVLQTRTGRNKIFVAFTRTKGWLRVFGVENRTFTALCSEVRIALSKSPRIEFNMPDMTNLSTIQRGLEDKHARIVEAKRRVERMKSELGLTDDEIADLLEED
ncbi:ATP-binding domain-containing protein [Azospirillum sp. RWY-5-1]|uniref:DNA 3'-5' helicase II n=1 Tax=Azospirillum oleiclasticum TaxID=2735135 RepID=A0ABX2T7P7_9PROT|nr:ATP-binding domain-containing protein [Azospirillum oleiclasticum]NYZ11804.1 ATP-binding domain-containing protein [Azospirillum oleiclasticum]NYZ18964.1 ATP-binding domain-containing protein [Azospirillum oleiclasticum]